jgi:hypothetical protein
LPSNGDVLVDLVGDDDRVGVLQDLGQLRDVVTRPHHRGGLCGELIMITRVRLETRRRTSSQSIE